MASAKYAAGSYLQYFGGMDGNSIAKEGNRSYI